MVNNELKVLLIDDDEDDFVNIRDLLGDIKTVHYKLTWKADYREGLESLLTGSYDACLLDYQLGQSSGIDLITEANQAGSTCPIILLTGHSDFDLDLRAMQVGASDYLIKNQITSALLERAIRYSMKHALDMRDISEQKENFKVLFNSTFEGVLVLRNGGIIDANAAACEIFKRSREELSVTPFENLLQPEDREAFNRNLGKSDTWQMEAVGLTRDESEIHLTLSGRKIMLKGQWVPIIGVRDQTMQKQMEAQILQQDRLASLGLLASSLAHEIGTPLGVIRGRAEMLGKSSESEKVRSTMDLIVGQIDRIAKLVHSLLHLARAHNSESIVNVDLAEVLGNVIQLVSHEVKRKNIRLEYEPPTGIWVRAEAGPLGQVVLNLLVNAIHAIEAKKSESESVIAIRVKQIDGETEIAVQDTGCGISEKNFKRLFQPFFTTKEIGVGTGLGLATSYKLVSSWGGSIRAESREGVGSTFTIILNSAR